MQMTDSCFRELTAESSRSLKGGMEDSSHRILPMFGSHLSTRPKNCLYILVKEQLWILGISELNNITKNSMMQHGWLHTNNYQIAAVIQGTQKSARSTTHTVYLESKGEGARPDLSGGIIIWRMLLLGCELPTSTAGGWRLADWEEDMRQKLRVRAVHL